MSANAFEGLDEKPFSRFHVLAMFTTGMGVFTDGYDLSSIGLVLPLVLSSFGIEHITGVQSGLLTGAALVGSVLGAILAGFLAQKGRKRFYGIDVAIMAVAAAAQAFAPGLWTLIAIRFVLGIGVGADYVLSPTIMAEHSNRKDRGKKLGFGFGMMWGFGAISAALALLLLQRLGVPPDYQWRIVLGGGAVPALSVVLLRRRMPETARFLARVEGDGAAAREVIQGITGDTVDTAPIVDTRRWHELLAKHARGVLGAALLWMLYDIVLYSGVLFGPSVIARGLDMTEVGFTLLSYAVLQSSGALLGCLLVDRIGRRTLTAVGFGLCGLGLFGFAPMLGRAAAMPIATFAMFGLYNFALSMGPGTVSGAGLLGVELAPTRIRSIAQAITVVGGRIGAALAAFVIPELLGGIGASGLMTALAAVSIFGAVVTFFVVPETAGRSLEDINDDTDAAIAAAE
ncbi:MAG TPA: MFS transporter [Kofleriaceae bacterium]|jgi:MFS family permease